MKTEPTKMKIQITFKTPDAFAQISNEEADAADAVIKQFVRYGELVTIEFDTEAGTAVVLPVQLLV